MQLVYVINSKMFEALVDTLKSQAVTLSLLAVASTIYLWNRHRKLRYLPPGPTPLPLLGNLLDFASRDQLGVFRKLREKYGDLVTLHVGSFTIIVVSGYDTLRELFVKRGDVTSDRPDLFVFREITKGEGIISKSGPEWKIQRTFSIAALRDFGFGKKSLEGKIIEEAEVFLQILENQNEAPVDITTFIQTSVSNIICSIIFGNRFEHGDPKFLQLLQLMDENTTAAGSAGIMNMMPFLRYIPGDPIKTRKVMQNAEKMKTYLYEVIDDHKENYNEENINDLIDAYLKEIKSRQGQKSTFTESELMNIVVDLFYAGTETTATTINWMTLFFLNYPDVQEKCHEEVNRVVGEGRFPSLSDRQQMPYTEAVIAEVLRRATITPFGVPHSPSQDISFKGYTIPKGAMLLPIIDSVHSDPTLFSNPDSFDPSRFIAVDGKFLANEHTIPFFFGRRVCMGEALARNELFLFLTSMVQRFQFKPEDAMNVPPIKGVLGGTYKPCTYKCIAVKRW